jgi:hypothetical protein
MSSAQSITQTFGGGSDYPCAVKNTFIHIADEVGDAVPRRSSSSPPLMRFSQSKTQHDAFSEVEVSTDCTDDDFSSVTGGSEHGNPSEEDVSPAGSLGEALAEAPAPQTGETRLNSSAKIWIPDAPRCRLSHAATVMFAQQLEKLVMITKATLFTCVWIQSLEVHDEGSAGWSIVARLLPRDFQYKEHVLTLAKGALTNATASVNKICMVGCRASPFVAMPLGFASLLVGVPGGRQTCWGLLQTGFCAYGDRCRREHPVYQRKVYVKVMLPDSW